MLHFSWFHGIVLALLLAAPLSLTGAAISERGPSMDPNGAPSVDLVFERGPSMDPNGRF